MMDALDLNLDFGSQYGIVYLSALRDGDDVTGRVRRVARRIALDRDRLDEQLFRAEGGVEEVTARLMARWTDSTRTLKGLTAAQDRLIGMLAIDRAHVSPMSIRRIDDLVGYGVFAEAVIRAKDVIGEYTGVLRKIRPEDAGNHYLAETPAYGRYDGFVIDGQTEGNITRFINHSHETPNVSNEFVFHHRRWHRLLRADRDIQIGEQILWDYGMDYWRFRDSPCAL